MSAHRPLPTDDAAHQPTGNATRNATGNAAGRTAEPTQIERAEDVRQGGKGKRVLMILVASLVLLLGAYAAIALFSQPVLTSDVPGAQSPALTGPSEAQDEIIQNAS